MHRESPLPVAGILFASVLLLWIASLAGLWALPGIARWSVGLV